MNREKDPQIAHYDEESLVLQVEPSSKPIEETIRWIASRLQDDTKPPVAFIVYPRVIGPITSKNHPRVARAWHHDNKRVIGLVNEHDDIQRGPTIWSENQRIITAFRSMTGELRLYMDKNHPEHLGLVDDLRCDEPEKLRFAVKRMAIAINLKAQAGSKEAAAIRDRIEGITEAGSQKMDWRKYPRSTAFFSDRRGFHRSSGVDENTPRFGRILID